MDQQTADYWGLQIVTAINLQTKVNAAIATAQVRIQAMCEANKYQEDDAKYKYFKDADFMQVSKDLDDTLRVLI